MKPKIEQQQAFWNDVLKMSEAIVAMCDDEQSIQCFPVKVRAETISEECKSRIRTLEHNKKLRDVLATLTDEQRSALAQFSEAFDDLPT